MELFVEMCKLFGELTLNWFKLYFCWSNSECSSHGVTMGWANFWQGGYQSFNPWHDNNIASTTAMPAMQDLFIVNLATQFLVPRSWPFVFCVFWDPCLVRFFRCLKTLSFRVLGYHFKKKYWGKRKTGLFLYTFVYLIQWSVFVLKS